MLIVGGGGVTTGIYLKKKHTKRTKKGRVSKLNNDTNKVYNDEDGDEKIN
jgi:hypothetical protein